MSESSCGFKSRFRHHIQILICYNITMHKGSIILNSVGLTVSFFCFLHCVLVILSVMGILNSGLMMIDFFEDPYNHAVLIFSGITLATLSMIKFNFKGKTSLIFIMGIAFLIASFFMSGIYPEIFVAFGAISILSMHAYKIAKSY